MFKQNMYNWRPIEIQSIKIIRNKHES